VPFVFFRVKIEFKLIRGLNFGEKGTNVKSDIGIAE
jgi:hypothetical protein